MCREGKVRFDGKTGTVLKCYVSGLYFAVRSLD